MEPSSHETKSGQPRGPGWIYIVLLNFCMFILSVVQLISAWEAGQTWRIAFAAVILLVFLVAFVTAVYVLVRRRP
jgi:hypothetical protein